MLNNENTLKKLIDYHRILIQNENLLMEDIKFRKEKEILIMNSAEESKVQVNLQLCDLQKKIAGFETDLLIVYKYISERVVKKPFLQGQIKHSAEYIRMLEYSINKLKEAESIKLIPIFRRQIEFWENILSRLQEEIENNNYTLEILRTREKKIKEDLSDLKKELTCVDGRLKAMDDIFLKAKIASVQLDKLFSYSLKQKEDLEKIMQESQVENTSQRSNNVPLNVNSHIHLPSLSVNMMSYRGLPSVSMEAPISGCEPNKSSISSSISVQTNKTPTENNTLNR